MNLAPKLLWIDCSGGATVGIVVCLFHGWLASWYALPAGLVLFMGLANLAYGAFSFSLARRQVRPRYLLNILISANIAWGVLCACWLLVFWEVASVFGVAHLLLEALFVAGLGLVEWRYRALLG